MNGLPRGQAQVHSTAGKITLTMPADAMYVILQ
jgi:hypothetical protein